MAKRDEMLAVITSRDAEIARNIALAGRYWHRPLLARWLRKEARRLLALNQRDLKALPPQRHHRPRRVDIIALEPNVIKRRP